MASEIPGVAGLRTFKSAFCECFACPPEAFQERLLNWCLDHDLRPVAWAVRRVSPNYFRADLEYLQRVGETNTWVDFWVLANRIRQEPDLNAGFFRKNCHLRISGERLIKAYEKITEHRRQSLA